MNKFAKRMNNKQRKGFTLVELVVVILIIAILAAAIFLGGATVIRQARERQVQNDLRNFGTYVQDMLYENPELQYQSKYADGENFTYDPTVKEFTPESTTGTDGTAGATLDTANMHVLNLMLDEYLTDDFQLGNIVDAWDNPYCFSYTQLPASVAGDASSCIIVINSLGNNSIDESSDASANAHVATLFKTDMAAGTLDGQTQRKYYSAEDFVKLLVEAAEGDAGTDYDVQDDYGVVIVMIDGEVSTAYYGF